MPPDPSPLSAAQCLLWDFGDTLCDERFIWSTNARWMSAYAAFETNGGMDWCAGQLDIETYAGRLAPVVGLTPQQVIAHMKARCETITWHETAWAWFSARRLPQAIVTVNPRLFSDTIVPAHGLGRYADVIVTSWEEGTNDKATLCSVALERLGAAFAPEAALLIDNKSTAVEAWRARGGLGYVFTTAQAFAADLGPPPTS